MKRFCFLLLAVSMLFSFSAQQSKVYTDYSKSSGYDSTAIDSTTLANLEVLGRVWGYAKYHHPIFGDNSLNVDYELFELLPKVASADRATRNKVLLEWVDGLGEFKSNKKYYKKYLASPHEFSNNYEWASDSTLLGGELCILLNKLRYAKRENNIYISHNKYPLEIKEITYINFSTSDIGLSLLELFRYWNIIDSYAPNRNITDKPWGDVLKEYIPKIINNEERYDALFELNAELNDTHAFTGSNDKNFGYSVAPLAARFIENKLVVVDTSHYHSLKRGDEIISVDGKTTSEIVAKQKKYTSHSNNATLMRDAARLAFSSNNDSVSIEYLSNEKNKSINIETIARQKYFEHVRDINKDTSKAFQIINDSVGYINNGLLSINDSERVVEALKKTNTVIIDLRGFPKEYLHYSFYGKHFFKTPERHVTWKRPLALLPGFLLIDSSSMVGDYIKRREFKDNPKAYSGEIILLVNEETQSTSEYLTMCLQANLNATTIGSQTAGADGTMVSIPLFGNVNSYFSAIGVLYPDGTDTQRVGVRIDVEVRPTIEGIKAGRDELLEKALELIN